MKKNIIKISITLLILILIIVFANMFLYCYVCIKNKKNLINVDSYDKKVFSVRKFYTSLPFFKENIQENLNKNGIIVFGTNFDNGMLAAELEKKLKVPVYNREIEASFIQHAILLVENKYLNKEILNSKYAVFLCPGRSDYLRLDVYPGNIYDGNFLLSKYTYPRFDVYDETVLQEHKYNPLFIKSSVLYRFLEKISADILYTKNLIYRVNLETDMIAHMNKLREELQNINPAIKVCFLFYYENDEDLAIISFDLQTIDIKPFFVKGLIENFDEYIEQNNLTIEEASHQQFIWTKIAGELAKELY